ncbi:OmpW family outer membrane protein [Flavobacterium muglaense]|uniref:Outer membrane beta-barrel protein n=1 Tax=Flavobacterium muglaense TaxID=2764716 RepID=A0A923MY50_9FLAO|nr:OmpW family outer membrane protein [Flavobacterium muglaense]MBC5837242.1 outer membrane beta-barrel protein [Flavobacterium muglaense]MBC5843834.1 outer membrane beta-barrel protein [Flavobacterium muglaense]
MKKIILTVAAVFAFGFANAQDGSKSDKSFSFSDSDIFVEGNLGFNSTNNKNTEVKMNSVSFSPKISYFVAENLAVGVQVSVGSSKSEFNGTTLSKSSSFGAGVFGRYYFLDLGQRFKTYAEAGVNYGSTKEGLSPADVKATGLGAGLGLGINYFVTKKIVLNFALRDILSYSTAKVDGGKSSSSFGFDLNGNVANPFATGSFGVGYIF